MALFCAEDVALAVAVEIAGRHRPPVGARGWITASRCRRTVPTASVDSVLRNMIWVAPGSTGFRNRTSDAASPLKSARGNRASTERAARLAAERGAGVCAPVQVGDHLEVAGV